MVDPRSDGPSGGGSLSSESGSVPGQVRPAQTDRPSVTVVISEWNSARTIRGCLSRVLRQDYPRDRYSVILVDAGSTDETLKIAQGFVAEGLRVELRPGCTEVEGQRVGVALTESDIILFTNSDIYVPPDWISRHVAWQSRGYDLVGGAIFWGGDKYGFVWNTVPGRHPTYTITEGVGLGFCNCSVRRLAYDHSGGLIDLHSHQDSEFAFRVIRDGGKLVLDPSIEVYHDHPQYGLSLVARRSFGYAYNHMLLAKAFYGRLRLDHESPLRFDFPLEVSNLLGLRALRAYRDRYPTARRWGIEVGFAEFFFVRQFLRYPAHYIGLVVGYLRPAAKMESLIDLHRQTATS